MNLHKKIYLSHPTVVSIHGDVAYDADGNVVVIDENVLNTFVDTNAYKEQRAAEYPSIVDQLDTIYHNGIDAWKESIKAIKDKYPKA